MKIALLNLRLEISDKSENRPNIEYTAKGFSIPRETSLSKGSYSSVVQEDSIPPTPDNSRELTLEDYRGCRKLLDIQVETYNSEDYNFEEIDLYLSGNSMYPVGQDTNGGHITSTPDGVTVVKEAVSVTKETVSKETVAVTKEAVTVTKETFADVAASRDAADVTNVELTDLKDGKFYSVHDDTNSHNAEAQSVVRPKSQSPTSWGSVPLHFYSGNPSVEKVKGILHIYKDNHLTTLADDTERSELICMLAVPAQYTIHDLLKFNGPCLQGIEYMRIIRDGSPNQFMVLVKFRTQKLADEYYLTYNNTAFNSIESDVCHLVYVGRVEMLKESENACYPVPGMTELPNCPVCLERMDESVDGILTILCNHAFHMECLDKWGDTSCPVCRYCQTPEESADNRCMTCGSQESLWICLICGNIGCGRYVGLHAYRHFQETQHTYAMELGNNKVWDYVGDNYVHRLVQNKSDGKLVQVDEGASNPVQHEKLDALNLEYTYLLTNQLESQRLYFEEKMENVEKALLTKVHFVEEENSSLTEKCHKLQTSLEHTNKEKQLTEKKCAHLHTRLKKALHDLQEELEMNESLRKNQAELKVQVSTLETHVKEFTAQKDKELDELRDQLRDVMFYVEAQQTLQTTEGVSQTEIREGQVIVGAAAAMSPQSRKTRKKPR